MGQKWEFPKRMEVLEARNGETRSASGHPQYSAGSYVAHGIHCCSTFPQLAHCIFLKMITIVELIKFFSITIIIITML